MSTRKSVLILNSTPGANRFTKPATAEKWVKAGKAKWTDTSHSRLLLSPNFRNTLLSQDRTNRQDSNAAYDAILTRQAPGRPPLRQNEIRAIPILGNTARLLYSTPKASALSPDFRQPVRISLANFPK